MERNKDLFKTSTDMPLIPELEGKSELSFFDQSNPDLNLFNLVDSNLDPFLEIRQFLEEIRAIETSLLSADYSQSLGDQSWDGVKNLIFEAIRNFNLNK